MTFAYLASIDLTDTRLSTVTLSTFGFTSIVLDLSDVDSDAVSGSARVTVFNPIATGLGFCVGEDRDASAWMNQVYGTVSLGDVIQNHMRDIADSLSYDIYTLGISVTFDETTLLWTFRFGKQFGLTFGNLATAQLFGFSTATTFISSSETGRPPDEHSPVPHYLVGDITPSNVLIPVLSDVSAPTPNYEPEGIASQAVSASGAVSGLARAIAPLYRDWTQQYETKAKTLRLSAASSHPFTHQGLFEQCRTTLPFVVMDAFGEGLNEVFMLRAEGSQWKCERATDSNDTQFHVPYKTIVLGYLPDE